MGADSGGSGPKHERRRNLALRELLDEMLELSRTLSRGASTMTPSELERAQARLEWLADEIWEAAVEGSK